MSILSRQDPEIAKAIEMEEARQRNKIELILKIDVTSWNNWPFGARISRHRREEHTNQKG